MNHDFFSITELAAEGDSRRVKRCNVAETEYRAGASQWRWLYSGRKLKRCNVAVNGPNISNTHIMPHVMPVATGTIQKSNIICIAPFLIECKQVHLCSNLYIHNCSSAYFERSSLGCYWLQYIFSLKVGWVDSDLASTILSSIRQFKTWERKNWCIFTINITTILHPLVGGAITVSSRNTTDAWVCTSVQHLKWLHHH